MEIRNVRTYPVEFDGQVIEPDGVLKVPSDLGARLLEQPDNWAEVKAKSTSKPSEKES